MPQNLAFSGVKRRVWTTYSDVFPHIWRTCKCFWIPVFSHNLKDSCSEKANLVAESGGNKWLLLHFLEAICKVFRAHDEAEMKRFVQWQRQASIVAYLKAGTFIQPYHTSHFDIPTACLYGWLLLSRPYWGFKLQGLVEEWMNVFQLFQFQLGFRASVLFQNPFIRIYNYLIISKLYNRRQELAPLEI